MQAELPARALRHPCGLLTMASRALTLLVRCRLCPSSVPLPNCGTVLVPGEALEASHILLIVNSGSPGKSWNKQSSHTFLVLQMLRLAPDVAGVRQHILASADESAMLQASRWPERCHARQTAASSCLVQEFAICSRVRRSACSLFSSTGVQFDSTFWPPVFTFRE